MRLDILNHQLGVKAPADAFRSCPRCENTDLFQFEGEVFCQRCQWDSVEVHAEALAIARFRNTRASDAGQGLADLAPVSRKSKPLINRLLSPPVDGGGNDPKLNEGSKP